ncbi:MAG: major facilitator superfamily 1 [Fluviicola sp.]|jgi:UMF1 family MFS transporter|uniref:MFS transporter n=1 Tax=Fluviicola sp. TaxID=1917219 RepID=UPI0026175F1E|nr:MFS transporter [Fluviicola sp.]MDF3026167.1 major facilitator superfamily 1 [Fluviicola sp.]
MEIQKGDKKIIKGWVMYDWANSVYNLVISSAIFPIFYDTVTTKQYLSEKPENIGKAWTSLDLDPSKLAAGEEVMVDFFGMHIPNSALMSFVLSASFLIVSFSSPFLSGIADYRGNKKRFLQFFCYLGALSCMSLYFFTDLMRDGLLEVAMLSLFFASIGFWNSLVFYNSYLPEIAHKKDMDKISARGFSMGYFGSMVLLIICLVLIQVPIFDFFDDPATPKVENTMPVSYCFLLVGLWWVGFSQITYRVLPNITSNRVKEKGYIWKGFKELKNVFSEFQKTKRLKRYLTSFFFFNTGVQTVMLMATFFAKKEIDWPVKDGKVDDSGLIIAILLIQLLGAAGAFLMSRLSGKIGNIKTLGISLVIWLGVCAAAFVIETPVEFYCLACGVGIVMGGVQALARSTYSKYLPETEDHASYFSFYDATEKIGIVTGTLFFGLMEIGFESIRYSVVSVAFFFIVGLLMLFRIPKNERTDLEGIYD